MSQVTSQRVCVPFANFYAKASEDSGLETQLLYGESVIVLGTKGRFATVKTEHYSSPGCVLKSCLSSTLKSPTHRITQPVVMVYGAPSFKSKVLHMLTMNSLVHVNAGQDTPQGYMVQLDALGWMFSEQARLLSRKPEHDYVAVARRWIGNPYVWGSRTKPDCSALIEHAATLCGIPCPRNVGEQSVQLGIGFDPEPNYGGLRYGDFVFWTDPTTTGRHVAVMSDGKTCIHATIAEPYRGTVEQPLKQVIADQKNDGNGLPTVFRRFEGRRF